MGDLANSSDDGMLGTRIDRLRLQKRACQRIGGFNIPYDYWCVSLPMTLFESMLYDVRSFIIYAQVGPPALNILNALAIIWFPLTLIHDVH